METEDAQVWAAEKALADELRRVVSRLVLVRPTVEDLERATVQAAAFADVLDALPARQGSVVVSEAGLRPHDHVRHSPWSGTSNVVAPPAQMWAVHGADDGPEGRRTDGRVVFDPAYEGPPGHVHGGCVAGLFDELLGRSQLRAGFTGTLTVRYRRPTPLLREIALCAWVDRTEGRKRWVKGTMRLDGQLLCEAEGLFVHPREGDDAEAIVAAMNRVAQRPGP